MRGGWLGLLSIALWSSWGIASIAVAQDTGVIPDSGSVSSIVIPAETTVSLRVESPVSSRTALRGDKFDVSLARPIQIGGQVIVPDGARGKGEVIHVQGRGFGGRAGELLLAARYLEVDGRQLKLRGFAIAKAGANNTAEALAIPIAGLFITGTSAEVQMGHIGQGKTIEQFEVHGKVPGPVANGEYKK